VHAAPLDGSICFLLSSNFAPRSSVFHDMLCCVLRRAPWNSQLSSSLANSSSPTPIYCSSRHARTQNRTRTSTNRSHSLLHRYRICRSFPSCHPNDVIPHVIDSCLFRRIRTLRRFVDRFNRSFCTPHLRTLCSCASLSRRFGHAFRPSATCRKTSMPSLKSRNLWRRTWWTARSLARRSSRGSPT